MTRSCMTLCISEVGRRGSLKKGPALRENKYLKSKLSYGFLAGITPPGAIEKIRQIHLPYQGTSSQEMITALADTASFLCPYEAVS